MDRKRYKKGSLTVEAALVLPIFMTGLLALVSVLFMCNVCHRIQASLLIEAQDLCVKYRSGQMPDISVVKDEITENITNADLKFIDNGIDGIDMSESTLDGEYIKLCVTCDLVPLTDSFGILKIPLKRTVLAHVWCGYENGLFENEEYVYITDDSDVYHRDRDCSHIKLTIRRTGPDEVVNIRNNDGKRYRSCEICHGSLSDDVLYVTPEGDRYHKSITCPGLKRTVRAVNINSVTDRRPCGRCGR
ncbi:MAG: pilus assembly protein [Lachnospiraceae bacterium]|nr:pilus assembly protein [Lachnospiraceae bacterium]